MVAEEVRAWEGELSWKGGAGDKLGHIVGKG
jgi:hypothetical protein